MKKSVLVFLLLAIFSIQLIPIKEIGRMLYGNQMIEEICHFVDVDGNTSDSNEDVKSNELDCHKHAVQITYNIMTCLSSTPFEKCYSSRPADDTPTRPPLILSV